MTRFVAVAVVGVLAAGCAPQSLRPAEFESGVELCANCRMAIVARATAAQIVAPGEDPVFFDEAGCLRDYLARRPLAADAVAYVADHLGGQWVDARRAVFTQTTTATPMASGIIAHADAVARDADPAARGGTPRLTSAVLGGARTETP